MVGRAQANRSRWVGTSPAAAAPRCCRRGACPGVGVEASARGQGTGEGAAAVVVGVRSSRRTPRAEEVGIVGVVVAAAAVDGVVVGEEGEVLASWAETAAVAVAAG